MKLAKRLPYSVVEVTTPSSNILGDWSANSFNIGRIPCILMTNERTLLSVVLPLKESATFWPRFVILLQSLLKDISIPDKLIDAELHEYDQFQLTRRTNRHTLGSMNDFVTQVQARYYVDGHVTLEDVSLDLSGIPCGPLKYAYPKELARQVFAAAASKK
jgi:hypothetical protein